MYTTVDCIYPWTHSRKTCFHVTSNVWVQVSNFQVFPPNCEVLLLTLLLDTAQREDDYQKGITLSTICEIKWKNLSRIILSQKLGED